MGITHGVLRADLKPSDHIYTYRMLGVYSHHGICVEDGKVIHVTKGPSEGSSWSPPNNRTCDCEPQRTGVNISCLDCFTGKGSLCRYEYGASVLGFLLKPRLGTCTLAKSDPKDDVVSTAKKLLEEGFDKYDLFNMNCEDFALYCKTSLLVNRCYKLGRSGQASFALSVPEAVVLSLPLAVLFPSLALLIVLAVGIHAIDKYGRDVSKRDDVVHVPVDLLPDFRSFRKKVASDKKISLRFEELLKKYIRKDARKTV